MSIESTQNIITSHELRAAIIELKQRIQGEDVNEDWTELTDELKKLQELLDNAVSRAGSPEQFTLIHEEHWVEYCEDYASGLGETKGWPYDYIDWDKAAAALRQDYGLVDFDGDTYLVRM
jgi:uncharacterized protein CbrC (UPF0167 family)